MSLVAFEESTVVNGRHFEAYLNQDTLYRDVLAVQHQTRKRLNILDFGCGPHGTGRMLLRNLKEPQDGLHLYDPYANIEQPRVPNEFIATRQHVFGDNRIAFDIVNLSYVLCCMRPTDGRDALEQLRWAHPGASLVVVDYTLQTRSQAEVLQLLNSTEEMKWRRRMGEEAFASTRRQFTPESLQWLVRLSGYVPQETRPLDAAGMRAGLVATTGQQIWENVI